MAYGRYRRRYRRTTGRFRRRYYRRRVGWRGRRRYRRRFNATKSANVTLSYETLYTPVAGFSSTGTDTLLYQPIKLRLKDFPGFADYAATYSRYRVKKVVAYLMRQPVRDPTTGDHSPESASGFTDHFLIVPSRTYACLRGNYESNVAFTTQVVPFLTELQLRQSKWQKEKFPNSTRPAIRIAFYPYTVQAAFGPVDSTSVTFARVREGKVWTPMAWSVPNSGTGVGASSEATYFGPYVLPSRNGLASDLEPGDTSSAPTTTMYSITYRVTVQFAGQV